MREEPSLVLGSPYPFRLTVSVRGADQTDAAHHWILAEPLTVCCQEKPVLRFDTSEDGPDTLHPDRRWRDADPMCHTVVCRECVTALPLKLSEREVYSSSPPYVVILFYGTSTDAHGRVGTFDRVAVSDFVLAWVNDLHPQVLEAEVIGHDLSAALIRRAERALRELGWAPTTTDQWTQE